MPRRVGSAASAGMGLPSISMALPKLADGIYPRKNEGLGQYGSRAYPTVLEQYNRNSDYKRWRLGQEYYFGTGRSWSDYQIRSRARFPNGAVDGASKEITTLFPSATSPEKTWYCACRTRGSIILPQPLTNDAITLNVSDPDPALHTLSLNVNGVLTPQQVAVFQIFIGDQFEDSASGPNYPTDLVERDVGSVALTLLAANPATMVLTFDLSRPAGRVQREDRIYWDTLAYSPLNPRVWRTGRHLCSSFKFFCCCPDHLGGAVANLEFAGRGQRRDRFPLPNSARSAESPWESQGAGYYRQWRTLPRRRDERRDCKHIHALRWECGIPWLEPDDYPTGPDREFLNFAAEVERGYSSEEIYEFFKTRKLTWDRYILTVADVVGITLFPGSDPRDAIRPDPRPLLWNDAESPDPTWCRQNDWWVKRGTQELRLFNAAQQTFDDVVSIGGTDYPIVEELDDLEPGGPVIVK
jgi:hypothetical protein